jgi:GNAT superfamily N-acetyltransferase
MTKPAHTDEPRRETGAGRQPEWSLRAAPAGPEDQEFLFRLYASAKQQELAAAGLSAGQEGALLRMQFAAQQQHYLQAYPQAEDRIVLSEGAPIGRFYVNRTSEEILVVDMTLLPHARGMGLGSALVRTLLEEAEPRGQVVRSEVLSGNQASLRMGLALGFTVVRQDGPFLRMEWRPPAEPNA